MRSGTRYDRKTSSPGDYLRKGAVMPKAIKVGLITETQGAHLSAYFDSLAKAEEAEAVVLADAGGKNVAQAKKVLGDKLRGTYPDAVAMLRQEKPGMALVSLPGDLAPAAIDAALEAGCHVFAEKPACVRPADFERLVHKAQRNHRLLMLALANRLNPSVQEARRLIRAELLGKLY